MNQKMIIGNQGLAVNPLFRSVYFSEPVEPMYHKTNHFELIQRITVIFTAFFSGYGNHESSSIVIRYQHEITALKEMVNETLRDYNV